MRIACVAVPHFALRIAGLGQPALDGRPLVLASPSDARPVVVDCTPEAATQGIKPGMLLREVTALCPGAVFIHSNPARETAAFEEMTIALEQFSPLVEPAESGYCYVDLHGLERHDASVAAAGERLLGLVSPMLRPRVGIGPGKFSAWVAARRATAGTVFVLPEGDLAATLAAVPIWWLPTSPDLLRRLDRLGLRTLGSIAALPKSAMQARFGPEGRRLWELASGYDEITVTPVQRPLSVAVSLPLAAPTASREMLLIALEQLILRAFTQPALGHRHIRQCRLRLLIEDNRSWERELTFREPLGRDRLIETLKHRLAQIELAGPVETLGLELIGIVPETTIQELLPTMRPRWTRPLVDAARQLKQRYGVSPLYRIAEVEPWSRIPERRHALITYDP